MLSDRAQPTPSDEAQPFRLAGHRALVTAGSSGIGRATATALRAQGADVFITGTGPQHTAAVAHEIEAAGHAIADFAQPGQAAAAVAQATEALGGLDILFVNTGGPRPAAFAALTDADWLAAYHLILGSAIELTHAALPAMVDTGGRVIYLTSVAGVVRPLPGLHLSNVMRAGVAALAASLVSEYGPHGITFNVIAPGPIDTSRRRQIMGFQAQQRGVEVDVFETQERQGIPLRRFGTPDEIAALVVYLASAAAGFITGRVHVVDGGITAV